jgi:D-arginine dehydrogenase
MIFEHDIVVIGGGMAGAAISAHLSEHASVRLLEMEHQPGYHSTGRSAALFAESYGNGLVRALTRASRSFFFSPPTSFCSDALVKPRSMLATARTGQESALAAFFASAAPSDLVELTSAAQALELFPLLKSDDLVGAALYRGSADIDVHALHHGYLRLLKSRKGTLATEARVIGLEHKRDVWAVTTAQDTVHAKIVINAAGAWAGEIGKLAEALDVGLQPMKRTVCLIEQPAGRSADLWPMVFDVEEQFYLKPDAGMLLLSPCDETLTDPCDAQADELDIAIAVDRVERATTLEVKRIAHKWAGLRSFVKDRSPVVGYDPYRPRFFWLAALGGYGIQTAPALSRLAASLVLGTRVDLHSLPDGVEVAALSPTRLMPNAVES